MSKMSIAQRAKVEQRFTELGHITSRYTLMTNLLGDIIRDIELECKRGNISNELCNAGVTHWMNIRDELEDNVESLKVISAAYRFVLINDDAETQES